ncbi:OmpP1/FadL family transporter [Moritella sp. F3]|uniref:OmpP1/FadL family transporter n=1 Tax=Moritella sp. F3 TaxID=2718882 RepID=UPI0018E0DC68|nr:outer membrane protein transport protein [Moritella sp. F3]GIC75458.1 long-chain fatty acid transporter [Moritella sp. F1]GIC80603.1 long-chain fatty acid transporter [Moritella sp. F3]
MKKTLLALLICSTYANASGLLLQEAVVANAGTTGAGDGVYTETATASWTNPATMTHMGEQKTTVNMMVLDLQMDYTDAEPDADLGGYTGDADAETVMPAIGIFHVVQVSEDIHLGINFGAVGGSSIDYGTNWDGGNHLDTAVMTAVQLNPAMSYKIDNNWSVGVGAQINYGIIEVSTSGFDTGAGTDWAFGYNAGTMYQADAWAVGLSYRSKIVHEFDDVDVSFTQLSPARLSVGTELIIPAIADLSGSYDLNDKLTLLSSVQFHQWSEFSETPVYTEQATDLAIDRDWDDVWKFAVGADYQLNAEWALKAGFSYETSPQDDPTKQWVDLPVGEQYRYSVGATTYWDETRIDIFYEYADLGNMAIDRSGNKYTQITGEFGGKIHFIGANVTF